MRTNRYLSMLFVALVTMVSCRKIEHLSPVPYIKYTDFTVFDTVDILGNDAKGGRLKFYFEDGDGNLGLEAPVGDEAETTNMFFTLFRKNGGIMTVAAENDPLKPSSYRIPYMERLGQNKILKGTISVTFIYLFYSQNDTIRYDFFIKDRDLNESNVESTAEIIISVNSTYTK